MQPFRSWSFPGRVLAILIAAVGIAPAQDWIDQVFPERSFNFGTVARGSKVRHAFPIVNRTNSDLVIASVKTKCGCTEYRLGAKQVPPGTKTSVEAVLDTTKFTGYKASGLTLVISQPYAMEIDLNLQSFIRSDLVANPGAVDFGAISREGSPQAKIRVSYAGGRRDWAVTKMQTVSDKLSARLVEVPGTRTADGRVEYDLTATLKPGELAPGFFKDEIVLQTNDPNLPNFPVSVTANVQAAVSVAPSILNLGRIKAGQTVKKTVLVKATTPFKILELSGAGDEFEAQYDREAAKALHQVTLLFKAPAADGPFHVNLDVKTDLKQDAIGSLSTFATIEK